MAARKFWKGDDDDVSEDDTEEQKTAVAAKEDFFLSSESENEKRIVKSTKDKRSELLRSIVTEMKAAMKTGDMIGLESAYDRFLKDFSVVGEIRHQQAVAAERVISTMQEYAEASYNDKTIFKALSKAKAKALNAIRRKLTKNPAIREMWGTRAAADLSDSEVESESEASPSTSERGDGVPAAETGSAFSVASSSSSSSSSF